MSSNPAIVYFFFLYSAVPRNEQRGCKGSGQLKDATGRLLRKRATGSITPVSPQNGQALLPGEEPFLNLGDRFACIVRNVSFQGVLKITRGCLGIAACSAACGSRPSSSHVPRAPPQRSPCYVSNDVSQR